MSGRRTVVAASTKSDIWDRWASRCRSWFQRRSYGALPAWERETPRSGWRAPGCASGSAVSIGACGSSPSSAHAGQMNLTRARLRPVLDVTMTGSYSAERERQDTRSYWDLERRGGPLGPELGATDAASRGRPLYCLAGLLRSEDQCASSSVMSFWTRLAMSSRIARTSSSGRSLGSGSSQSR